jgi:hypothetical protein
MIGMTQTLYLAMPVLGLHKALILSLLPEPGFCVCSGTDVTASVPLHVGARAPVACQVLAAA